jgi:hypothetical protein
MARKTYKQKYKSKRKDYRKGGRVKAAVGGTQELKNITNYTPMPKQPVKKKPVQVGEPVRDKAIQEVGGPARPNRNLGNLRRGAAPTPPEGKLKQVSMVEGNPLPELSQAEKDRRQKLAQARIDANKKLMEQNPLKPVIQNLDNQRIDSPKPIQLIPKDRVPPKQPPMSVGGVGGGKPISKAQKELNEMNIAQQRALELAQAGQQPAKPSPRMEREAMNPATGKIYTPEEKRALDASIDQREFKRSTQAPQTAQAFQQAPTTGKGSDQMFIGREGDVRPQAAQAQTTQAAQAQTTQAQPTFQQAPVEPKRPDVVQPTLPKFPEEGKSREDILFSQQEAQREALNDLERRFSEGKFTGYAPEDLAFLGDKITDAINQGAVNQNTTEGWWTDAGYNNMSDALQSGQFTFKDGKWVLKDGTENQEQEAIDEELITARGRAEQILQGDMTGIPMAEAPREVEVGELGEAKTMAEREALEAQLAEVGAAPEAATIEDVTTAKTPEQLQAETYRAELVTAIPDIEPIVGELSDDAIAKVNEISKLSGPAIAKQISEQAVNAAKADTVEGILSAGAFVPEVDDLTPEKVSETPDAEAKQRQALTGEAAVGAAAQIVDQVGYEAAKRRPVKGTAAKGAAASMIAEVSELPPEITSAIVEDPATVEAQLDTGADPEVVAAIAALPEEALVSSQMESLLGGLEDGNIPAWARPAVDAINSNMASRGLSVSTVGRDSLFNAIIQSAMPMAQSNAQALQQRASQNLSNQQQANLQEASQIQQIRMQNLANRQDAASQTAQFAQQMGVLQSQFKQEAVMTTAQQQQQTRTQNLQNRQQAAVLNTQNQQAMNAQNLGNEQQMELANLEIMNQTERENMTAENQERLAEMNIAAEFIAKNADFKQQMNLANLSNDQQMKLANLSALNQASADNLNAEQQTELANLNKTMQINIKNAELAQQMGIANLNVDQQRAMANANTVANMDMAKFNNEQQVVLANSKFMQTATLANFDAEQQTIMQNATAMASLDLANLDQRTKLAVTNAQSFLAMDMANLSNEQQASMLKSQMQQQQLLSNQSASNAAAQFNASSENQTNQFMSSLAAQIEQFNAAQLNTTKQFNVSQKNARDALEFQVEADLEKANASMVNQINQFNEQTAFERDKFNTSNAQAIEQSNLAWRRQANMANTAAANQVNMQNAQNAFNMTSQAQSFLWQELRDQANYTFQSAENEENRKAQLYAQALANEGGSAENWKNNVSSIGTLINTIFGGK